MYLGVKLYKQTTNYHFKFFSKLQSEVLRKTAENTLIAKKTNKLRK